MVQAQKVTIAQLEEQLTTMRQVNAAAATQLNLERTTIVGQLEGQTTRATQLALESATTVAQLVERVANIQRQRTVAMTLFVCGLMFQSA